MNPIKTKSTDRVLGAPKNWNADRDGECIGLPVVKIGPTFYSFWRPTFFERIAMLLGRPIMVGVFADAHPPISLNVTMERNP